MKKAIMVGFVLFLGLSGQAFGKAGIADGGLKLILTLVGILLLLAGLLAGTDFLIKNRKNYISRFKVFLKKKILTH
jgi:hypothetical protein